MLRMKIHEESCSAPRSSSFTCPSCPTGDHGSDPLPPPLGGPPLSPSDGWAWAAWRGTVGTRLVLVSALKPRVRDGPCWAKLTLRPKTKQSRSFSWADKSSLLVLVRQPLKTLEETLKHYINAIPGEGILTLNCLNCSLNQQFSKGSSKPRLVLLLPPRPETSIWLRPVCWINDYDGMFLFDLGDLILRADDLGVIMNGGRDGWTDGSMAWSYSLTMNNCLPSEPYISWCRLCSHSNSIRSCQSQFLVLHKVPNHVKLIFAEGL